MDREELRVRLSARLAAEPGVATAYLFGSLARGDDHPSSDADVGVLFSSDPPRTLAGLHFDRRVQLVVLNRAPADLIHRVLRDGILLLDRDPSARIRFEVRSRNAYFDLLPILRRYRRLEPAR